LRSFLSFGEGCEGCCVDGLTWLTLILEVAAARFPAVRLHLAGQVFDKTKARGRAHMGYKGYSTWVYKAISPLTNH